MPFKPQLVAVPPDPVSVIVNGKEFTEWQEVDIDSDVFTAADGFSLTGTVPSGTDLSNFREGVRVDVKIGGDRQMAGVIDQISIDGSSQVKISIAGRDLGAYICDSETDALRFSNYTLRSLAEKLMNPAWGIKQVVTSGDKDRQIKLGKHEKERFKPGNAQSSRIDKPRVHTKIDVGQSVRQVLDQHCGRAGCTWWITAQGDLFIGRPQYKQAAVFNFFSYGSSSTSRNTNNLLSWSVKRSMGERYSELVVVGESSQDKSGKPNIFDPDDDQASATPTAPKRAKKYRGVATDPDLVKRGIQRRLVLHDTDALSSEMCQEKADEEMGRRRLSALMLTLTVDGFRQDNRLFTTDCLANVKIDEAGIDGVYWISQRKFSEKRQERRTTLTLHEKGVWLA
jgi:prophage tail gpP-like protein